MGVTRIVEGDSVDDVANRKTLPVLGTVGELCHCDGSSVEGVVEGERSLRRSSLLKDHLPGVFIGHRSGERQPDMLQSRAGMAKKHVAEPVIFRTRQDKSLEGDVRRGGNGRGLQQILIVMSKHVGSDSRYEIEDLPTVRALYPRSVANPGGQEWVRERLTTHLAEPREMGLVGSQREACVPTRLPHRFDERGSGFPDTGGRAEGWEKSRGGGSRRRLGMIRTSGFAGPPRGSGGLPVEGSPKGETSCRSRGRDGIRNRSRRNGEWVVKRTGSRSLFLRDADPIPDRGDFSPRE